MVKSLCMTLVYYRSHMHTRGLAVPQPYIISAWCQAWFHYASRHLHRVFRMLHWYLSFWQWPLTSSSMCSCSGVSVSQVGEFINNFQFLTIAMNLGRQLNLPKIFNCPSWLTASKALVRSTNVMYRSTFCSWHFSWSCLAVKFMSIVPLFWIHIDFLPFLG